MARINLEIPDDLKIEFQVACIGEGIGMSEKIRELIDDYVVKLVGKITD